MKRLFSKGHRVRNKDKLIPYWLTTIVALPFLLLIGAVGFVIFVSLPNQWIIFGIVIFVLVLISAIVVYRLYLILLSKINFSFIVTENFCCGDFCFKMVFILPRIQKGNQPMVNLELIFLKCI